MRKVKRVILRVVEREVDDHGNYVVPKGTYSDYSYNPAELIKDFETLKQAKEYAAKVARLAYALEE
jgi:hypothetical protein